MFSIVENNEIITDSLKDSFHYLEKDKYLKSDFSYRSRAFSQGRFINNNFHWESEVNFIQSSSINSYLGDVERQYPKTPVISQQFTEKVIKKLILKQNIPQNEYTFGCHQIRITASEQHNGYPTPEGFHQDGFDYVIVTCVYQSNINGGSSLLKELEGDSVIFNTNLSPGSSLILDDRKLKHYVSPITPMIPGLAYRDVIVVTLSQVF